MMAHESRNIDLHQNAGIDKNTRLVDLPDFFDLGKLISTDHGFGKVNLNPGSC